MSGSSDSAAAASAADAVPMTDVSPAASPSPSPSKKARTAGGDASDGSDAESSSFSFPAVPPMPLPDKKAANGQTTLGGTATWREFKLPPAFFIGRAAAIAEAEAKGEGADGATKPKTKKAKGAAAAGAAAGAASADGASASSSAPKGEKKAREKPREKAKKEKTKEELEAEKILPDPDADSPLDSFQRLVSRVRGLPLEQLQTAADADADADAQSSDAAKPSNGALGSLPAEVAVTCLAEVPSICHFTWLFQKQLYLSPIVPARLESLLLAPDSVLNESLCSELLSKLLYATRAHYPKTFRKRLELMQKGQRCFHYQLLCEWLFWLLELWIETWKRRCKREEERNSSGNAGGGQEDGEGEGVEGEGAGGGAEGSAGAGEDGTAPRKKRKYTRKSHVSTGGDSDSDGDAESEDPEEATAYELHTLPERKFIVNTEELCGNINPFAPPPSSRAPSVAPDQTGGEAEAAAASSSAAAAAAASPAAAAAASSSTPTPGANGALPVSSAGHKLLHETPLAFRAALLQTLCDFQLAVNPALVGAVRHDIEGKDLKLSALGRDAYGKTYYYSGFSDYRIYAQGYADLTYRVPKTPEDLEEERRKKAAHEAEQAEIRRMADQLIAQKEAEKKQEEEAKKRAKMQKQAERDLDEDAPLSSLQHLQKKPPMSSLAGLPAPAGSAAATSAAAAAALSPTPAAAAAESASSTDSTAPPPAPASVENSPGLPFRLRDPEPDVALGRRQYYEYPAAPPFALVASSAAEIRALVSHIQSQHDPRNRKLIADLLGVVEELDAGRGRQDAEEEAAAKRKKEPAAPKRMSDRLVTQELAREEAERLRLLKWEEESRSRNTRRNRWLDDVSQRTLARVRRAFEKMMGIEKKKASKDGEEGGDESDEGDDDDHSSDSGYASHTDDEDGDDREVRRTNRKSARTNGSTGRRSGSRGRVTRNQGRATASMAESETESEEEADAGAGGDDDAAMDEDDEGCAQCGVVEPTDANPIILCDRCDKQWCLRCIPLDEVPKGSFFCKECTDAQS